MTDIQLQPIYEILFQTAAEGLIVTDSEGKILVSNPRITEMFYFSEQELKNKPVECIIPKRYTKKHQHHRSDYLKKPGKRSMGTGMNLTGARKDGSEFPVEVSLNSFEISGKRYVMALISDITERKKAEDEVIQINEELEKRVDDRTKELHKSQLLYNLMARNFPNGTINVLDSNLNYVFVEGQELHRSGVNANILIGTNYLKRLDKSIRDTIKNHLKLALNGNNTSFEVTYRNNQYLLSAVGLHNNERIIDQILVVEQNITKQKEAEKQVREALEKEKQLNELKSRFVSMASHEFRTPLSTILSSASLLQKYSLKEQQDKREGHIQRIKSSVHNLTSILNDFLSLDKLEAGKTQVQFTEIHIDSFLKDLVADLQVMTKKDQKIILNNIHNKLTLKSDKLILRNIITNLISNAIKYSEKDILIDVKTEKNTVTISVKDQGIGIPNEEQKHIFERLFRAKNVMNIQGTGLGLNIVSKYMLLINGKISFDSKFNEGSCFNVTLFLS